MESQKITFGIPQIKVTSAILNSGALKSKSDDIQRRIGDTRAQLESETAESIRNLYSCYRNNLQIQRKTIDEQFGPALTQMDAAIQSLKNQGADPTKVAGSDGRTTDFVAKRAELAAQQINALATFDSALKQLDLSEQEAIAKLRI